MVKRRTRACAGLSALPIFFVAMAVADGIEPTGYVDERMINVHYYYYYVNIITHYLNTVTNYFYIGVNTSFDDWFPTA